MRSQYITPMTDIDFTGVFPAMTTPFTSDGRIDHETLAADARRLDDAGVAGLVPAGSTGESATLTHDEHIEVVETVVEAVDNVPVIAGSGSNSTHEAVSLSHRAADAGADGLLLIAPYYNKPEQAGFREHFEAVADAVDLPQIVYNVPSRTGQNVEPETVADLASHENIAAHKAASGDVAQVSEVIERTRNEDFAVLSGDDVLTLPMISLGGRGVISVAGNVEPERMVALVAAALDGDFDRARELHIELSPLFRQLFAETNPIPVTAAMAMRGHAPERLRSPLTELSAEPRAELEAILTDLDEHSAGAEPTEAR